MNRSYAWQRLTMDAISYTGNGLKMVRRKHVQTWFKLGNLPAAAFPAEMGHNMGAFEDFAVPTLYIYISINLGYWIDTMWCPLVVAYWFLSPTVDMCTINRCYSMFWSLRYSSVGLWLGHLEIAVGVYIDGHIDLQIKRTTGINWLDRLSRNVVFFMFLGIFRRVYITFCHVFLCFFLLSNGGVLWRYPIQVVRSTISVLKPCQALRRQGDARFLWIWNLVLPPYQDGAIRNPWQGWWFVGGSTTGKRTNSYGKSPCLMGKSTINQHFQ